MAQCRRWNLLPWTILGTTILIALPGLASEVQGPLVLVPPNEALEISSGAGAVETVTPGNSVEDSSMTSDYGYFPDDSEPVERGSERLAHGEDFISPLCAVATSGLGSVNLSFCNTRSYDYYYQGSLGPGAISAIVIAAVLGVSVLFSLIIITVRKLSAS